LYEFQFFSSLYISKVCNLLKWFVAINEPVYIYDANANENYYLLKNDQNTVLALYQASDTTGSVPREQYEYSSYGITNILDQNGLVKTTDHDLNVNTPEIKKVKSDFANPFGYHGMWRDEHTGLYHTHYRLYDPQHVRWLTPDPAGYRDGQNLYRFYAGPNGVDVLGLDLKGQSGFYSTEDLFKLYALFEEDKNSKDTFNALLEDLNLFNDFGALPIGSNEKEEMLKVIELLINMSIADDESTLMEEIEKSEKIRQDNQSDGMKALAITGETLSPLPKIANATAEEVLTSFIPVGKIVTWGKRIKAVAAIMRGGGKVLSYTASKLALFKSRVSKAIADKWARFRGPKYAFANEPGEKVLSGILKGKASSLPGSLGINIGKERPSIHTLQELTKTHDVEFSLIYKNGPGKNGGGGDYFLYSGSIDRVRVPIEKDMMWIYHTHPGSTPWASSADKIILKNLEEMYGSPQRTSVIIPKVGKPVPFKK